MNGKGFWRYETLLMVLLSLNFGIVFFDRNAMSFLGPFVQKDLRLTDGQIANISALFAICWGLAGLLGGAVVDRLGHRKLFLVCAIVVFSLCSIVSGLAASFGVLLLARAVMGVAEGPMNPIQQSFAAAESSPERRGANMGFVQNFGSNLFGSFVAPLVIVWLAVHFGWRHAFFVSAAPGVAMALAMLLIVREPKVERGPGDSERMPLGQMLRRRNLWLCMLISLFMVPWLLIGSAFLPLVFAKVKGYAPETGSYLMSAIGAAAVLGSLVLPPLSDRIGRKPVLILGCILGMGAPLAALFWGGSAWGLGALLFVGYLATGTFPVFMATVPSETISARLAATAVGLTQGLGEVVGGGGIVSWAGHVADQHGTAASMWVMAGCALLAGLLSLGLKETAPRKVGLTAPALEAVAGP